MNGGSMLLTEKPLRRNRNISSRPHPKLSAGRLPVFASLFSIVAFAQTTRVHASFDLGAPAGGPFPSNLFTVPDLAQISGLRISLPLPDCNVRPSDCEDLKVINTLDGFNLQPRISIPFD